MVGTDGGDDTQHGSDHIGGIEASAKARLDHGYIDGLFSVVLKGKSGSDLKEGSGQC
jgi:hypothetical protein